MESRTDESEHQDRCWNVPVAMAAAAFMVCMPWSWFGLLLVYFMEEFEISRETASWPKSIASVLSHVSGLARVSFFSAFASNILWMSMTLGVMHGLGHGVFVTSATVYTLLHFEKYRGIATSLAFIAYGASSVISQIVLAGLVELYDIGGALLVYGGVLLNATVVVMLAKNPWPLQLSRKQGQSEPLLKKDIESTCYEATTNNTSSKQSPEDQCLIMPEKKMLPGKLFPEASPGALLRAIVLRASGDCSGRGLHEHRILSNHRGLRYG
ncbi:hypothetical protein MRX96_040302 [Rhipicephalus microplus]